MIKPLFPICLLAGLMLASCTTILNNLPGVYSLEIQQGNIVDQAMVDQLRAGMSKRQVLYIMGSPMLVDTFHQKRWDYLYADAPKTDDRKQKRITLIFEGDQLVGIQGDLRPADLPVVSAAKETVVVVPKRNLERTMWEKITGWVSPDETEEKPKKDHSGLKPANSDTMSP
jgi:outer membrane protein assembly factor BamE